MAFGNGFGVEVDAGFDAAKLFGWRFGGMILETVPDCMAGETIGRVAADYIFRCGVERAELDAVQAAWEATLEPVMPNPLGPWTGARAGAEAELCRLVAPGHRDKDGTAARAHPGVPRHKL